MKASGHSLQEVLNDNYNMKLTLKETCLVGVGLLHSLERLHSIGKVQNNLKIRNILMTDKSNLEQKPNIMILNLEYCTDFLT